MKIHGTRSELSSWKLGPAFKAGFQGAVERGMIPQATNLCSLLSMAQHQVSLKAEREW